MCGIHLQIFQDTKLSPFFRLLAVLGCQQATDVLWGESWEFALDSCGSSSWLLYSQWSFSNGYLAERNVVFFMFFNAHYLVSSFPQNVQSTVRFFLLLQNNSHKQIYDSHSVAIWNVSGVGKVILSIVSFPPAPWHQPCLLITHCLQCLSISTYPAGAC